MRDMDYEFMIIEVEMENYVINLKMVILELLFEILDEQNYILFELEKMLI